MLKVISVMEQRYQAVLAVIRDGVPIVEVARRFDVSRQTIHPIVDYSTKTRGIALWGRRYCVRERSGNFDLGGLLFRHVVYGAGAVGQRVVEPEVGRVQVFRHRFLGTD